MDRVEAKEMEQSARQEDIRGNIDRARRATERRDWLEARRCWDAVRASSPDHAPAYLGAGQASREAGLYDDAERTLGAGAERFPNNEQIAMAHAWLAHARRDWPAAVTRWETACARFPDNPWCYLGTIKALRGAGRNDQVEALLRTAETVLEAGKRRGLDAISALRTEFEIARERLDWPAVRECAGRIIASDAAPSAQVLLALAQAHWHTGHPEEADRAALRAIAVDPALVEALLVRVWVATDRGDGETALDCYRTLSKLNPAAVRWRLKLVQLLSWLGHVKEALSELENVRSRWPNDPMVRTFARNFGLVSDVIINPANAARRPTESDPDSAKEEEFQAIAEKAPDPAEWRRPLVVADPESDVLLAELKGCETALLVFTGTGDEVSMPLLLVDRYLATLNLTVIYLKDFQRLRFLLGVQSLSDDYHGTLVALRRMLAGLGVKRLCTMGNCVGGFAAIRYGVELGADRILAFGAPTYTSRSPLAKMEEGRKFMRTRLEAKVPHGRMDLKTFLKGHRHDAKIELFYEERDPRDRMHTMRLSGLPGVRLHPQQELSYRLLRRLALSHPDFRGLLADLLGIRSSASA